MLAARGVSLGLGKINLSDLNQLPGERHAAAMMNRKRKSESKPKIIIKKKADAKTVWAACRAVIFGSVVISFGLAMTALGYFDKHLSKYEVFVNGTREEKMNKVMAYQLKSMQYIGPILMGIGTFVLIIACVITLESRDKHAQVIQQESQEMRKKRLSTQVRDEDKQKLIDSGKKRGSRQAGGVEITDEVKEDNEMSRRESSILAEVHRAPRHPTRPAPLAIDEESGVDIPSSPDRSPRGD